jgi:hypothetical protein
MAPIQLCRNVVDILLCIGRGIGSEEAYQSRDIRPVALQDLEYFLDFIRRPSTVAKDFAESPRHRESLFDISKGAIGQCECQQRHFLGGGGESKGKAVSYTAIVCQQHRGTRGFRR